LGPLRGVFRSEQSHQDASFDCTPDRQTVSLALRCPAIVEGQQPNCDRRRCTLERSGVDLRRSTSELKFDRASNFMRRALEVAAELHAVVSQKAALPPLAKAGSERVERRHTRPGFA